VFGNDRSLWLATRKGLLHLEAAELQKALRSPGSKVECEVYDALRGWLPSLSIASPKMARTSDGKLWFASENGMQMLNPENFHRNSEKPQVAVENVVVDRHPISPSASLHSFKRPKDLEIDYTALSFVEPRLVQFRYRLIGQNDQWQDPGSRRQAFYSDLSPGEYSFQVIASNNDGVWNRQGASYSFVILPAFYQTWWFKSICGLACVFLLWVAYTLRVRSITGALELRNRERERIARDLHDTLFQGIEGGLLLIHSVTSRIQIEPLAKHKLNAAFSEVNQVMASTRSLIFDQTMPGELLGFEEVITAYGENLGFSSDSRFAVVVLGKKRNIRLALRQEVLKIVAESLSNAFRHADAKEVKVQIVYTTKALEICICDDGVGIDPVIVEEGGKRGHFGLSSMRQRAIEVGGQLTLSRRTGGGTEVRIKIPASHAFRSRALELAVKWLRRNSNRIDLTA
jgi:signal transduction histidine kinase